MEGKLNWISIVPYGGMWYYQRWTYQVNLLEYALTRTKSFELRSLYFVSYTQIVELLFKSN